ncbi:MAG TPA: hypothetical protein VMM76_01630 [Pirellulaceae bacterium]|nr:hypothetical protein [Pirellulaceae bacterium]
MTFESWYIEQFRGTLGETLSESEGIPDSIIDSLLDGRQIPEAMRAYYRVAGNHWLNTNHNQLRPLGSLEFVDGYLIFMDENQVVVQWAIRDLDLAVDDPIVYQGQHRDSGYEWHAEKYTFSRFMIAMWRWILTGEDPG